MTIEELHKHVDQEVSWLKYYGSAKERQSEEYSDANFYDRIVNAGYAERSKRTIPLPMRCVSGYITSKKSVLESTIEELECISDYRNHDKNIYTPLEYMLVKKLEGYEKLIELLRS